MLCLKGKIRKNGGNILSNTINAQRQWNNNFKMLKPREEEEEEKKPCHPRYMDAEKKIQQK